MTTHPANPAPPSRSTEEIRADLATLPAALYASGEFTVASPSPLRQVEGRLLADVEPLLERALAAEAKVRAVETLCRRMEEVFLDVSEFAIEMVREGNEIEAERRAQTEWSDDDVWLSDEHARFHDQPGNMFGRDDCGEARCDFWDAAVWVLNAPGGVRSARQEATVARSECHALRQQVAAVEEACREIEAQRMHIPPSDHPDRMKAIVQRSTFNRAARRIRDALAAEEATR